MKLHTPICTLLLAVTLTAVPAAAAQSAYVPLDDVAYVYLDALIARGELRGLSVLERPYTVGLIRAAMAADSRWITRTRQRRTRSSRGTAVSDRTAELRSRLERAIGKYDFARRGRAPVRAELSASLWATGETSSQRELMLANDNSGAFAGGAARFLIGAGPVVGFSRPILENRLNTDPDFRGRTDRRIAGRLEDGYVSGQWRFGELFFGRTARNWGPAPLQGLLLSSAPFTYDHLFGRLGNQRVNISLLLARLDDDSTATNERIQRHVATHRLSVRWRAIEAAIAESFVYTGVGRGFEPTLANPFSIYALTWRNEKPEGNLLLSGQLAARTRLGIFSGELLLDDIQIDRCDTLCEQPSSYGLTLTAEGVPFAFGQRAFASYTRVSALTYRNKNDADRYTAFDVSMGRGFSDYDEFRMGADVVALGVPLRPYFAHRRQGEGDYRVPFPPPAEYATQPGIFEGEVTRISRVAVSGGAVFGSLDVRGDVGYNSVDRSDAFTPPPGADFRPVESGFEGRVRVSWNPRWARIRFAP
ncbi:MAG TPA: hypothetical protein VFZ56_08505 [Gemmatimonadaceae bacterium]